MAGSTPPGDHSTLSRRDLYAALRAAGAPREWARRHDGAKTAKGQRAAIAAARRNAAARARYARAKELGAPRPLARGNPGALLGGEGLPTWWRPFWAELRGMDPRDRVRLRVLMARRAAEGPGALSRAELSELDAIWDDNVPEGDWRDILYGYAE